MHKRILMVYDEVLLELTKGIGLRCWFRKNGICMNCAEVNELTRMCNESRQFLDLCQWNWVEVTR